MAKNIIEPKVQENSMENYRRLSRLRSFNLLLVIIIFTFCLDYFALAAPRTLMPEKGWVVNTWGGKAFANISFEDAPDATKAIRFEFGGAKQMANAIMPKEYVTTAASHWPSQFRGFQTFVWNDGEVRTISISFGARTEIDGKQVDLNFKSFLKVDHKGWKLLRHDQALDYQYRQAKLIPSQITSIYISVDRPAKIALGALTWVAEGTELRRLEEGNSVVIFKTPTPPVIDGNGGDAAWKDVPETPLSHVLRANTKPSNKTRVKLLYDEEKLYLFVTASFKNREGMKINTREFDESVYEDECIEVILYPGVDVKKYGQFIINPHGIKADLGEVFDQVQDRVVLKFKNWNPQWQGASKIGESSWSAEIAIPWKAVEDGKQPSLMKLQVGRNDTTAEEYALWAPSSTKPSSSFGVGVLNDTRAAETISIPQLTFQRDQDNKYSFSSTILANGFVVRILFLTPSRPFLAFSPYSRA